MTDLNIIIDSLTKNDKKEFINTLEQKNRRQDTKNIQLFKLISQGETNSNTICLTLYGNKNKNAYHALRKRLFDSLIDYTANKNLKEENSIDIQVIKYILAARTFLLQKNFTSAYKLLDKAELLADENSLFPILNEIYHTKIQYATEYDKVDLGQLINKQNKNRQKHYLEDSLNIVYAKLKTILKDISRNKKIVDFQTVLEETLKDANIQLNESLSFKSLYQILAIANISAFVTTRYYEIEDFVLKSYEILKSKKETHKQLYYQIQIVYIIANTLFRNKKFEASLGYIDEMEQLMLVKNGLYYRDFILKHNLVKALNLNYSNNPYKAIEICSNCIANKTKDIETLLDIQLTLLMFYFQQNELKKARHTLSKFYHTDKWYIEKSSVDWVIKKNLAEILLYIELGEDNLFYSRLKSFKRNYSTYLNEINQIRILTFLNIAEYYFLYPEQKKNKAFEEKVKQVFNEKANKREDIFIISFYAWLKNKFDSSSLYTTTLNLLKTT
mgnify:CR=1 FL=1